MSRQPARIVALVDFVRRHRRLAVLTGAGCSTESGIPDYRDGEGRWKHRRPMSFQRFLASPAARRRYWAGSMIGWRRVAAARPNPAHESLSHLETSGRVHWLITQNVDGLHQKAGSRRVTDLHGRLDRVICVGCRSRFARAAFQAELERRNPGFAPDAPRAPDGDARIEAGLDDFVVPPCPRCAGMLKPDVVFFGERVPPRRVDAAFERLGEADALLVVGSSLMVWSGRRFVDAARQRGKPVAAVNLGWTKVDRDLELKVESPCAMVLTRLVEAFVGARAR